MYPSDQYSGSFKFICTTKHFGMLVTFDVSQSLITSALNASRSKYEVHIRHLSGTENRIFPCSRVSNIVLSWIRALSTLL